MNTSLPEMLALPATLNSPPAMMKLPGSKLSWQSPPTDAGHDAATLFRIERADLANGTFDAVGASTTTDWHDIDAATAPSVHYYLVTGENSGGGE